MNLRDLKNEWTEPAREFAESLWDRFRRFADPHFLTEVRRDFHPRFWEMYLTCALQESANRQGSTLSCPKPGPDILLERDGSRVWVVATNGISGRPDSVVEPNRDGSGKIPEEKLVLRYANAISEKYRKYRGYLRDGIIHRNDAFVIPHMRSRSYGRIVNIASIAGKEGNPRMSPYSATKAGVIGFTKSIGKELATDGVCVNAVSPAVVQTRILDELTPEQISYMTDKIPMRRTGKPEEIAYVVHFLASPEASFVTAQCYDASGGRATY